MLATLLEEGKNDFNVATWFSLFVLKNGKKTSALTGVLYIGLENVQAPCTLSLYFELANQLHEQSLAKDTLKFWYLTKAKWSPLSVLKDSTYGFTCSGVILFAIPEDIALDHPQMPKNRYWISVTVSGYQASFIKAIYLNSQAVRARRINTDALPIGETPMLKPDQITATVEKVPEIEQIQQPFPSFNGRSAENQQDFRHRGSMRIKTKDRASSVSDYKRLAFEACPNLYYAKCISALSYNEGRITNTKPRKSETSGSDQSTEDKTQSIARNRATPGEVQLGLVNGYTDPSLPNAFRPVVDSCHKEMISRYFETRISPFVRLKIFNLKHQEVTISCPITFKTTFDQQLL